MKTNSTWQLAVGLGKEISWEMLGHFAAGLVIIPALDRPAAVTKRQEQLVHRC